MTEGRAQVPAPLLALERFSKRFGRAAALDSVDLGIGAGEFVTLLGPSGSGKTTALMALAGFVAPDEGRIWFEGRDISRLPPERRGFGVVFQGYALFPHMTVAGNVGFALRARGVRGREIAERVGRALDLVQLRGLEDRRPAQLSGGQQQRVAIARALVYEPPVLLLDEPLSALDKKLRQELQRELKALHRRIGVTFVNVTHDQDEALSLSTRVALLRGGRLVQFAAPQDIYDRPATAFVADFVGGANVLPGEIVDRSAHSVIFRVGPHAIRHAPAPDEPTDGPVSLVLRPEILTVGSEAGGGPCELRGRVTDVERVGPATRVTVDLPGVGPVRAVLASGAPSPPDAGCPAVVRWADNGARLVRNDL